MFEEPRLALTVTVIRAWFAMCRLWPGRSETTVIARSSGALPAPWSHWVRLLAATLASASSPEDTVRAGRHDDGQVLAAESRFQAHQ